MTTKYTKEHEWVILEGDIATVGITNYAQEQLGDVVFVELPELDETHNAGDEVCVVESVKAASDIYIPLNGTIVKVNEELESEPALINTNATDDGWIFKMKLDDVADFEELLTESDYTALIA